MKRLMLAAALTMLAIGSASAEGGAGSAKDPTGGEAKVKNATPSNDKTPGTKSDSKAGGAEPGSNPKSSDNKKKP